MLVSSCVFFLSWWFVSTRRPCLQVDSIGDITITNDGATILKLLEVDHPAAKVLVDLAELQVCVCSPRLRHSLWLPYRSHLLYVQDSEVGDGTTSVVIIAAELLRRANDLVRSKVHPTSIMSGYRLAMKEAVKYIKSNLTVPADRSQRCAVCVCACVRLIRGVCGCVCFPDRGSLSRADTGHGWAPLAFSARLSLMGYMRRMRSDIECGCVLHPVRALLLPPVRVAVAWARGPLWPPAPSLYS